jgi:excisionase family DNA binding protein
MGDERTLTIADVALRMGVPHMAVYRMVHAGELPAIRVGPTYRVPEAAVRSLLEGGAAEARSA